MRFTSRSQPRGCCLLLLLYTGVERHNAGSSWARYVGNVIRRGCLDCPAISRLSALLSVQLFLLWSLGAQNGWLRTDRLGPQTHTGSPLSQSTSAFLCPEFSRQVTCSREFGFACALRHVFAPVDWLSAFSEGSKWKGHALLFDRSLCSGGTQDVRHFF